MKSCVLCTLVTPNSESDDCGCCSTDLIYTIDIHSVSPHVGPANGGTLLTIKGRGFGNDPFLAAVDIDGTPCTVVSVAMDTITCRTTTPPGDSKAVVNNSGGGANVILQEVDDGYRFMGRCGWLICNDMWQVLFL